MTKQEGSYMIENKKNRKFPISFNPQEWESYVRASCYLYALNIFKDECILVGDMIGKRCDHEVSDETLIKVLKEELEYIGYKLREIDKVLSIAILISVGFPNFLLVATYFTFLYFSLFIFFSKI